MVCSAMDHHETAGTHCGQQFSPIGPQFSSQRIDQSCMTEDSRVDPCPCCGYSAERTQSIDQTHSVRRAVVTNPFQPGYISPTEEEGRLSVDSDGQQQASSIDNPIPGSQSITFSTDSSSAATSQDIKPPSDITTTIPLQTTRHMLQQDSQVTTANIKIARIKPMATVRPQLCESVRPVVTAKKSLSDDSAPTPQKIALWERQHSRDNTREDLLKPKLTLDTPQLTLDTPQLDLRLDSLSVELMRQLKRAMGPGGTGQHSAVLKRSAGPSLEMRERDWPCSKVAPPPPISPCTNPFISLETRSSQCLERATIAYVPEQHSPSATLPKNFTRVIDEYSKVAGYDASKDPHLKRAYHLLEESRCYYGKLSMQEARKRLKHAPAGAYLVRDSSDPHHLFALSVKTVRGTTSIRISYSGGMFQLDCEENMLTKMPVFDCIIKLLEFYTQLTAMKDNNMCVFLESTGRRDTPVVLTKPWVHSAGSLKSLCRRTLNGMLTEEQRHNLLLFMPPDVESFIKDYPYKV